MLRCIIHPSMHDIWWNGMMIRMYECKHRIHRMDGCTDMAELRNRALACILWQRNSQGWQPSFHFPLNLSVTTISGAAWSSFGWFRTFGTSRCRKCRMHQNGTLHAAVPPLGCDVLRVELHTFHPRSTKANPFDLPVLQVMRRVWNHVARLKH